jgi:lipopolysaccharide export system protein LptA
MGIEHRNKALVFAGILGVASPSAQALSTDREQNIVIEAQAAEADDRTRITVYRGDVVITQGTLRITGDTVWIHMEYFTIEDLILLLGDARYSEGKDTITAPRIEYDSLRGRAKAGPSSDGGQSSGAVTGESEKSDRVRITITPKKK